MANRYVYYVDKQTNQNKKTEIEFKWFPGFSKEQKQKSIKDLHIEFKKKYTDYSLLEVSSKSTKEIGIIASAFNLKVNTKKGNLFTVEQLFQSSKVYKKAGDHHHLLTKGYSSKEMKKLLGQVDFNDYLIKFNCFNQDFPLEPKNLFYNWLYVNALKQNSDIADEIIKYDAFTDIEFNPKRSYNCQAEACSIFVSLYKNSYLNQALKNITEFKKIVY